MILNSYAVLIAFVAVVRLIAGGLVGLLGFAAWRAYPSAATAEQRSAFENRSYLLFLLTLILLILNLASWPLLYLLLQSYVPEWPGVMCIYGVMQVGKGSLGPSRFLPDLLELLQLVKPALVFTGGMWFVIYVVNRSASTAPLMGLLFIILVPFGALATLDSAAELTYVAIPKRSVCPTTGCCTVTMGQSEPGFMVSDGLDSTRGMEWYGAFYAVNLGMILALHAATARFDVSLGPFAMSMLLIGCCVTLVTSSLFLVEVAAPTLLRLPFHHCPYDLIPEAPEAVAAIALFISGVFCLGWAVGASWFGRCAETEVVLAGFVRNLLRLSQSAFLSSLLMLSLELILA